MTNIVDTLFPTHLKKPNALALLSLEELPLFTNEEILKAASMKNGRVPGLSAEYLFCILGDYLRERSLIYVIGSWPKEKGINIWDS